MGDRNQLPPINENESFALVPSYLTKKFNLKGNVHFLTEVKRQEDGSDIMKNAINTRIAIEESRTFSKIDAFKFNCANSICVIRNLNETKTIIKSCCNLCLESD